MGLDLTLGGLVLFLGIRGWLKGFLGQAVRLAGAVACFYVADPVRDLVKPRVIGHLPHVHPEIVDRLLWWSSAVASYVVLVGVVMLALKMSRRKAIGEFEPRRNDQFAGFLLGSAKGVVVAALLLAAFEKYATEHLKNLPWIEQQANASRTLRWSTRYQPVPKVWAMPPVQHFVNHIQRMGLASPKELAEESEPVATADQTPKLALPPAPAAEVGANGFDRELNEAVRSIEEQLRMMDGAKK